MINNAHTLSKAALSTLILSCCTAASSITAAETITSSKPNVLMIAVDDLNDWIGCMGGHPQAITPNIDRLAEDGVLFLNNHCQAPICGPSRASLMTGLHPTTTGIYLQIVDNDIQKANPAAAKSVYLTQWFRSNGYKILGSGKILHCGGRILFDEYGQNANMGPKPKKRMKWPAKGFPGGTQTDWGAYPERDNQMPDFKSAAYAVKKLKEKHDKPFFLAVGFCRPHVPWYVPQKWFDLYPIENIQPPAYLPGDMDDVPEIGRQIAEVLMMPTTEWAKKAGEWKNIVQAYLACTTFADAQVGKVLDALRASEYADNTIVVLWADHGYHLGEKNRFAKQAIWERDTRTVLIFKAPSAQRGGRCEAPTELLDIYPTLLDLCGLPPNPQADGDSLATLLKNPDAKWNKIAVTSYGVGNVSLRDRTHRYIVYEDGSEELYDMIQDPNEWTNLAGNPEQAEIITRFKKAIPKNQAPLSQVSYYNINNYWRAKVRENKERGVLDADGKTVWHNAQRLGVEGKGWLKTESFYDRLPLKAKTMVRTPVWGLSHSSAGMRIRFQTDAKSIQVRWTLTSSSLAMPHMPATGVSGIDLYSRDQTGRLRFCANGRPTALTNKASFSLKESKEYVLYLPLYNGIKLLEIGVPKGKTLSKLPAPSTSNSIVFYGTSIIQGACASRPGMAATSIVSRELGVHVINLGFSGNGKMEIEMAELLSEIDPAIYVLDCLWNMTAKQLSERLEPFIIRLRETRPSTPIILAEDSNFKDLPTEKGDILRETFAKLIKAGDKHLYILPNKGMLGEDSEGTVDGCHPNDLGMSRQAAVFVKCIKPILKKKNL